jgi:hypothetical protein
VVYRKGELSKAMMDREWPHHVALPAFRCHGHNYVTMRLFCEPLSLYPRPQLCRRDDGDMTVFCFAERRHAEQFRERFGGEFMDPGTPPKWPRPRTHCTDISLALRQRNGCCANCAD